MTDAANTYRSIFISDVHLGSRGANADFLIDFLRHHEAETFYLVGDIVDGWQLKKAWHWPQSHNDVVQKLLRKARKGARVVYIAGNHDEFLRKFPGTHFGGIEVTDSIVHVGANGKKYLVIHGDQFDVVVMNARTIAHLGDWAYQAAMRINLIVSFVRRLLNLPYWSFSAWAKLRVKKAVNFIGDFQKALTDAASAAGADGVICGHIHHAAIEQMGPVTYINTGDWVESCTAVLEHHDGTLELITWTHIHGDELTERTEPLKRLLPVRTAEQVEAA